jgi:hypothetical protein
VSQKLMIIVLVAVAVIFVIAVGIGGCHGSTRLGDAGAGNGLKGLQGKHFLVIGDKASTNCTLGQDMFGRQTLTVSSSSCAIFVGKRSSFRRPTRVVFVSNLPISVSIDPVHGPHQDPKQVNANDCSAAAIDHSGGTMTFSRLVGSPTITLLRQACR